MSNKEILIISEAFSLACKFIRSNPPEDIDLYPKDMIVKCLVGAKEDPNGDRYMSYFLEKALEKIGE